MESLTETIGAGFVRMLTDRLLACEIEVANLHKQTEYLQQRLVEAEEKLLPEDALYVLKDVVCRLMWPGSTRTVHLDYLPKICGVSPVVTFACSSIPLFLIFPLDAVQKFKSEQGQHCATLTILWSDPVDDTSDGCFDILPRQASASNSFQSIPTGNFRPREIDEHHILQKLRGCEDGLCLAHIFFGDHCCWTAVGLPVGATYS